MATKNEIQSEKSVKPGKFGTYIMNHKMIFFLLLALIAVFLWAFIKTAIMKNQFEKQTLEIKKQCENKIDSITAQQMELTSKTFAWAIRSELTRDNKEQVNQFFTGFIKESGVVKVQFVDAISTKVLLSTDKKDEGSIFEDKVALFTTNTIHYTNDSILHVISPVMGLNNKLGVLVIDYSRK